MFLGRNGSGKSRLLRSWYNQSSQSRQVHLVQPERSGEFTQDNELAKQLVHSPSRVDTQPASLGQGVNTNRGVEYRRIALTRVMSVARKRILDGISDPVTDLRRLAEYLEQTLVGFNFTFNVLGDNVTIEAQDQSLPGGYVRSSGEDEVISLLIDLWTVGALWHMENMAVRVVLLDEPDLHLHPDLQIRLAQIIVQIADQFDLQLAIATHSLTLTSALGDCASTDTAIAFVTGAKSDAIQAKPFDKTYAGLAGILGGQALLYPLAGAPLLLVEGSDDFLIWSQVSRNRRKPWAIVPCNGDEIKVTQRALEAMFASLRSEGAGPVGYALLDGDKPLPGQRENNQRHILYLRLACRESENLFLTDEVLAQMGLTWETAVQQFIAAADANLDIHSALNESPSWDRKQVDLKNLIKRLARILDSRDRPWYITVGQCLRDDRPSGQMAEFLGDPVLDAFWPAAEMHAQQELTTPSTSP